MLSKFLFHLQSKFYNMFMGGIDKSDQLASYHRIAHQTKKYWKIIFYHLLDKKKTATESTFRDAIILQSIRKYSIVTPSNRAPPSSLSYRSCRGSIAMS